MFATISRTIQKVTAKEKVNIVSDSYIVYNINNKSFYQELLLKCMEEKLLKHYDDKNFFITFDKKIEKRINEIIKQLKTKYTISINS